MAHATPWSLDAEVFPIIGMVHLAPLPGSPRAEHSVHEIAELAVADARALLDGGVAALLVENYGDTPFVPRRVDAITVAAMSVIVARIVALSPAPVGVQVLRNDALSALAIAAATGARFIRVNVFAGLAVAGEGLLRGESHAIMRRRRAIGARVEVWADFRAKHAAPLGERDAKVELAELSGRAGADAIVVSGAATGSAPDAEYLASVRHAAPGARLVLGSGLAEGNAAALAPFVDAAIVGTSVKQGGITSNPVDAARVRRLVDAARSARR
ncbi:MAG: BtpA/SgcQ family protein [bacterium]